MGENFNMSQQCALTAQKANYILVCIKRSLASESRELSLALRSAVMRAHLKNCPALGPPTQEKSRLVGKSPDEGHKVDQRAGAAFLWSKSGVVQPEEEKALGRSYSSLPVPARNLQESWRWTF